MRWILLSFSVVTAVAATTLLRSTFDDGPGAWVTMGQNGALRVAREAADQREGRPSLAFDYEIGSRKFGAMVLPLAVAGLTGPELAAMDQVHFWMKTDYPTSVGVILSEKGGGNYSAVVWSPGGVWQEVKVEPRDFVLSENKNDPPDPDGKLDVDQLQGIGLADLGQMFSAGANPSMPFAVTPHPGKHTLMISSFEVLAGTADSARQDGLRIDQFDTPQLSWMCPGGASLRIDNSREHAPGPALEVTYEEDPDAMVLFSRNLPPEIPADITHISFDIASEKPVDLAFSVQEKSSGHGEGPRYATIVEVKGGGKSDHRDLALSALVLDANGPPDPQSGLSIVKAKTLAMADISARNSTAHGPNKVWISDLRFTAPK